MSLFYSTYLCNSTHDHINSYVKLCEFEFNWHMLKVAFTSFCACYLAPETENCVTSRLSLLHVGVFYVLRNNYVVPQIHAHTVLQSVCY